MHTICISERYVFNKNLEKNTYNPFQTHVELTLDFDFLSSIVWKILYADRENVPRSPIEHPHFCLLKQYSCGA